MIVNILEPKSGILLDPACGSGRMFVQSGDFVNAAGMNANSAMTFYGQEKVEYNAQLCLMNMAVHGLTGVIKSGDEANTFYHDAHNLVGCCDYVMANPPFNVDKVKSESCESAGRLPFGLPGVNKSKEVGNANYLWISYFYAYLNETGRAGFVMASSATDSQGKDKDIRQKLVETGHVDVMISVGNNFFYTKSLPCSLWFFDKGKPADQLDKVLFIDARNYYTVVDRTLNEWTDWQLKNLNAIVWLYRGETEKYRALLEEYFSWIRAMPLPFEDMKVVEELTDNMRKVSSVGELHPMKVLLDAEREKSKAWHKEKIENADRRNKKAENDSLDRDMAYFDYCAEIIDAAIWLTDKFGEGEYRDIPGLCKVGTREEIEAKGWSLTPGAYVGVVPVEDDGVDFKARMAEIQAELLTLQAQSNELMETISRNMKELGI